MITSFFIFIFILSEIISPKSSGDEKNNINYDVVEKKKKNSEMISMLSVSYEHNYKLLLETSERNNRVICVKKEYDDLIYYTHDNECDPQNTFSFSFNSTFKFDENFYLQFIKNKESFTEIEINPYLAIGSCISCFFLDEMNLLSMYGYTFVYRKSSEVQYKRYYQNIIDQHYHAVKDASEHLRANGSGSGSGSGNGRNASGGSGVILHYDNHDEHHEMLHDEHHEMLHNEHHEMMHDEHHELLHASVQENQILQNFLKENRIYYTYDEIGKGRSAIQHGDMHGGKAYGGDVHRGSSLEREMIDSFFTALKEEEEDEIVGDNDSLGRRKSSLHLEGLTNLVHKEQECKFYKEDINKKKIWTNVTFVNSFTKLNILSHIDKYSGTYDELKHFSFHEKYKREKVNDYLSMMLDLENKEYLLHSNVFILIANEEIKFLKDVLFCSTTSNDDTSISYIHDENIINEYEKIKSQYMSKKGENYVFLLKVLYHNNRLQLVLVDSIRGSSDPMKLSIPFFFLVSHSHFSQFTHFSMKDNLIGWVKKSKILYIRSVHKMFSCFRESMTYTGKPYDVVSVENKIISNIYLLYLSHTTFRYVIFGRYNPIKNYALYKNVSFEAILLNMISTFTVEELTDYKKFFEKITKKEIKNIKDIKKRKRMDVFEIFVIPSDTYLNFQNVLSKLFKAIFDCGGKHISKLVKIAVLRSHYDMLYNFNCYNYQLYSFLVNLLDLHKYYYEHADLNGLFLESQEILKDMVIRTLNEMNNLIPFNSDKTLIKYLIIILYSGNDMFCLDKENSMYIQLIYELRHLNISHAIIVAYLSGDKHGTLCSRAESKKFSDNKQIGRNYIYETHVDDNAYLKHGITGKYNGSDFTSAFLRRFDNKYFGDFHITVRSDNEFTLGIFLVSFTATVIFIVGELHKETKRIYVYRIFKNIFIKNYSYNITRYYTFWNSKLYAFTQYEPECVLLFNRYNLYEKKTAKEQPPHEGKTKSEGASEEVTTVVGDLATVDGVIAAGDVATVDGVIATGEATVVDDVIGIDNATVVDDVIGTDNATVVDDVIGTDNATVVDDVIGTSNVIATDEETFGGLGGLHGLRGNDELVEHFNSRRESCLCDKNMINKPKGEFVVSEYLQLRSSFMEKMKDQNRDLYERMLNYNFFNDPLDISYKTKNFQYEKLKDICKDIQFKQDRLCLFHKSRIILAYLYLLSTTPDLTFYVVSPLVFIKPQKYCDQYDIPLVLNNMLKNRNFYKKSSKICINYAFAHFISAGDKTSNLIVTAKISGTMVNISKNNLLLLFPLSKRVDILDYSKNNEYDIKEEIINEYFILGNPYTPINIISYSFKKYDVIKKNSHITISGAFVKQEDDKFVTYHKITEHFNEQLNCTESHAFEINGEILCFCDLFGKSKNKRDREGENNRRTTCLYPFCEESKKFCYINEECVNGHCVCIDGYFRNPMSSLCEKNNECFINSKDTCKDPGKCVLANNRYVCLCPFPYVRVLKNCLHPLTAIKMGLRIFNNFENDFSNDEDDASKTEKFYTNVFGSMSEYIRAAINDVSICNNAVYTRIYIVKPEVKSRIYVKPIKKLKNGIKATIIINQKNDPNDPNEPTPIEVFNIFLNQLSDSTSALNNGFYAYFARHTYIEYVKSFSKNDDHSPLYECFIKYLPTLFIKIFRVDIFNDISIVACINFIILIIVTFMLLFYFLYLFVRAKFLQSERVKTF
ncbi:conserved Plasmodium protein, unknown function [Plasmodium ovale]|uniref:EGF-like domain-containing protein n=1 Tax=Plasmodium ovale TaxID=36330 RepID=A0A1D3U7R6_PLAOA|nr:conserved Plasmodium protein, unknown function [Plasmodium ovale]